MRAAASLLALLALPAAGLRAAEDPSVSTAAFVLPSPPEDHVDFSADSVEFVKREDVDLSTAAGTLLKLEGHVVLKETTWTIRAGDLLVDLDSRTAAASSGLEMDDGSSVVYGDSGFFDLEAREGRLLGARAGYPPWRIQAAEAQLYSDRRVRFKSTRFTSCDEPSPDYHFRASSVHLKPKQYLWAWNPVFYVGKVPIFYSPFLWKSLKEKHLLRARVSPGYDRRNGVFARSTTLFNLSPALYGKLYLDYYGSQGPGGGAELQYRDSEDSRGVLYGYTVRDKDTGRERWSVVSDAYRTLSSSYSFQARLQAQSDADFNNDYSRTNAFRVTPELVNGAAFVRRTGLTTTRLSYSRLDRQEAVSVDDPGKARFVRQAESMPRLDFQTAPLALKGTKWLATVTGFADNQFELPRDYLKRTAGGAVEVTRPLNLRRGLSLTPKASFGEAYESRFDDLTSFGSTRTYQDVAIGRYQLGGDLRLNSPAGYWDAEYSLKRRLKPDTMEDDAGAMDRGVEESLLSLQDTLMPRRGVVMRFGTGYDFRRPRDQEISFRRRVQPFFGDVTWSLGRDWDVSLREEYQLEDGNRAFLVQADWGERGATFAGLGMLNTFDHADTYLASAEAGWAPSSASWRVAGALRCDIRSLGGYRIGTARLFEKEVSLVKMLHDFYARVLFRVRPGGVKEVTARVEMLGGLETARKIVKKGWEREWFPWRKKTSEEED